MTVLRALELSDRDRLLYWRNLPTVAHWMLTDHEITAAEHSSWFERILSDSSCRYWVIQGDAVPVGVVNLARIDLQLSTCEFGIYIAEEAGRGRGLAAEALSAAFAYAFEDLGLNSITADVFRDNPEAISLYSRLGLEILDESLPPVLKKGVRRELVRMKVTKARWAPSRQQVRQGGDKHG